MTRMSAVAAVSVAMLALSGCGTRPQQSQAPVTLIIDTLQASRGFTTVQPFATQLFSDVLTFVNVTVGGVQTRVPTVFADIGRVQLHVALKNPKLSPSASLNSVTLQRYHVEYRRADGRNEPGVTVPYAFDGGLTVTALGDGTPVTGDFELVRVQAKLEPPLRNMVGNGGAIAISTIAVVTFFGVDGAGHPVTGQATIGITFSDFGDPS